MKGLIDTTLREGVQAAGVTLSLNDKRNIVCGLIEVGIEEIELGIATASNHELSALMSYCRSMNSATSFSLWSMCRRCDIEYAATLEPDVLSLSIPVSDLHILKKLHKSRDWVLRSLKAALIWAKAAGIRRLSLGLEDTTRAKADFLTEVIEAAAEGGVARIRLADTVGISTPHSMADLIKNAMVNYDLEFGVHTHNDFGMATANCLAALEAGADWADVTILGLGERAGNARLEEAVAYLAIREGRSYRTEKIRDLSEMLSLINKERIPARRPVVGRHIFSCETGLHLQGLQRDPKTYEPYPPQRVGAKRRLLFGRKIGHHNIRCRLSDLARPLTMNNINEKLRIVQKKTIELGRPLEDSELTAICL